MIFLDQCIIAFIVYVWLVPDSLFQYACQIFSKALHRQGLGFFNLIILKSQWIIFCPLKGGLSIWMT